MDSDKEIDKFDALLVKRYFNEPAFRSLVDALHAQLSEGTYTYADLQSGLHLAKAKFKRDKLESLEQLYQKHVQADDNDNTGL